MRKEFVTEENKDQSHIKLQNHKKGKNERKKEKHETRKKMFDRFFNHDKDQRIQQFHGQKRTGHGRSGLCIVKALHFFVRSCSF